MESPYQYKKQAYSSHVLLKKYLENAPACSRILDVGTSTGILGQMMAGSSFQLFGIEPNSHWVKIAKDYYVDIFNGNLDEASDHYISQYNVVVCTDVLEHMCSPHVAINRLSRLQENGTWFLISVPNIANIWIRLNLLFGKFTYTERGILDRTHLRFFTLQSFRQLLVDANLSIQVIEPTPIPLSLVNPFFEHNRLGVWINSALLRITRIFPTLFAYQFFCFAIKQ